jgi:hypothetical protein
MGFPQARIHTVLNLSSAQCGSRHNKANLISQSQDEPDLYFKMAIQFFGNPVSPFARSKC